MANVVIRPEIRHDWQPFAQFDQTTFGIDASSSLLGDRCFPQWESEPTTDQKGRLDLSARRPFFDAFLSDGSTRDAVWHRC